MTQIRTDWTRDEIAELFELPFTELLFKAVSKIIDNEELRGIMRQNNMRLARQYTAGAMADAYERLYRAL